MGTLGIVWPGHSELGHRAVGVELFREGAEL
jgi:hypothetical protein